MKKLLVIFQLVFVTLLIIYIALPIVAWGFWELPLIIMLMVASYWVANMKIQTRQNNGQFEIASMKISKAPLWILIGLLFYVTAIPLVTTWSLFR